MNAHINLDLGITAAKVAPDNALPSLQNDFNKINGILAGLVDDVKTELSQIWPTLILLDQLAGDADDEIIKFSMTVARNEAWKFSQTLVRLDESAQRVLINKHDLKIAQFGKYIADQPFTARSTLLVIRLNERGSVAKIIDILT